MKAEIKFIRENSLAFARVTVSFPLFFSFFFFFFFVYKTISFVSFPRPRAVKFKWYAHEPSGHRVQPVDFSSPFAFASLKSDRWNARSSICLRSTRVFRNGRNSESLRRVAAAACTKNWRL